MWRSYLASHTKRNLHSFCFDEMPVLKKSPPNSTCIDQSLVEIIEVLNIGQPRTEVYPVVNTKNLGTSLSKMVETVGE